ncbi:MAG: hypothetical protein ACREK2_07745, partial [Gemmatimonadota bacterium]
MSATSGATARPPAVDYGILHWAAGSVFFELVSPVPAVLDRARVIFGPWLNGVSGPHPPKARFMVEREEPEDPGRWRVVRNR